MSLSNIGTHLSRGNILNISGAFPLWVGSSAHQCCLRNVALGSVLAVIPYWMLAYQSSQLYHRLLGNIHALHAIMFSFCNFALLQIQWKHCFVHLVRVYFVYVLSKAVASVSKFYLTLITLSVSSTQNLQLPCLALPQCQSFVSIFTRLHFKMTYISTCWWKICHIHLSGLLMTVFCSSLLMLKTR